MKPPIFIFGVPRSGTTLLRTILNCHPHIACGPEAPWLAHQGQNILALHQTLVEGEHSYCQNFGVAPAQATARIRELIDGLFSDFARQQKKIRWGHKTPDDSMYARFFVSLFPEAKFIHLIRHPLDVALSTTRVAAHRTGVSTWHEENLVLEPGVAGKNNRFNSVLRWRRWNDRIAQALVGTDHLRVSYEELVSQPTESFRALFTYLDEPFDPAILDYQKFSTIFPAWEWGSADVRRASSINTGSIGRWKKEMSPGEVEVLNSIAASPAPSLAPHQDAAWASPEAYNSSPYQIFAAALNDLATSFTLRGFTDAASAWSQTWWWFQAFRGLDHSATRSVAIQPGLSPFPWLLALLGQKVTLIDDERHFPSWKELRDRLKVNLDWRSADEDMGAFPFETESVDVVLHYISNSKTRNSPRLDDIVHALKTGGMLAVSCEKKTDEPSGAIAAASPLILEAWQHVAFGGLPVPTSFSTSPAGSSPAAGILIKI